MTNWRYVHETMAGWLSPEDYETFASSVLAGKRDTALFQLGLAVNRSNAEPPLGSSYEMAAYVDALIDGIQNGRSHHLKTADEVREDLNYQPVIGTAADLLRSGFEHSAVLEIVVEEGYAVEPARGAIELLRKEASKNDVCLEEISQDQVELASDFLGTPRYLLRFQATFFESSVAVFDGVPSALPPHGRSGPTPLSKMDQIWRITPKTA